MATTTYHRMSLRYTRIPRTLAILVTLSVLLSMFFASAAHAEPSSDPAKAAAGWLGQQLIDDERLEGAWTDAEGVVHDFVDHGGTADVIIALAATGVGETQRTAATSWLISEADSYTGLAFDAPSAGALAKLILAIASDGRDPRAATNVDYVAALLAREALDGEDTGRYIDGGDDDWSSSFTQALALMALAHVGVEPSPEAIAWLVAQTCEDGGVRFAPDDGPCVADTDSTAVAAAALLAVAPDAAEPALSWLVQAQGDDGGFGNANTTAMAAMAFAEAGSGDLDAPLASAQGYLESLQDGCEGDATGRIDYDHDGSGDPVFATRQAILGLAGVSYTTLAPPAAATPLPSGLDCSESLAPWVLGIAALLTVAGAVASVVRRQRQRT